MKRLLNLSIAIILLLGLFPASAGAESPGPDKPPRSEKARTESERAPQGSLLQQGPLTTSTGAIDVLLVAADSDTEPDSGLSWSKTAGGFNPIIAAHGGSYVAGLNSFHGTGAVRLQTGPLNLSAVYNPQVSFYMSHDYEYYTRYDNIQIQVSTDGTNWTNVGAPVLRPDPGCTTPCWKQHIITLAGYGYSNPLYIGFLGDSLYGDDIYLDDVEILNAGTPVSLEGYPEGFETSVPPAGWGTAVVPWEGGYVERWLHSYGDIGAVGRFDANSYVPDLTTLQDYDVVLTWSNDSYHDPAALGNVLADYVDWGGKVINLNASMDPDTTTLRLAGRFVSGEYPAMWGATSGGSYPSCLGLYEADHRIMKGIPGFCAPVSPPLSGMYLTDGSSAVAYWDYGALLVAAKDNRSVVSINAYVGMWEFWDTAMYDMIHNAIQWLLPSPSDPNISVEDATGRTSLSNPSTPIMLTLVARANSVYNEALGDYECPALEISIPSGPAHGTLDTNQGNGYYCGEEGLIIDLFVQYTPDASYIDSDSFEFTFRTYDNAYYDSGTATIVVNQPPVAPDGAAAIIGWTNATFSIPIQPDPDGDDLTIAGVNQLGTTYGTISSSWASCSSPEYCYASFSYTLPDPTPDPTLAVDIQFTYQLSDGTDLSNWGNGTLKVGDVPEAFNHEQLVANNYTSLIIIQGSDGADAALDFEIVSPAANGNLSLNYPFPCPSEGPIANPTRLDPAMTPEKMPGGLYSKYYQKTEEPAAVDSYVSCASVTYNAWESYSGEDSFTFVTNDGYIDSLPATVKLHVQKEAAPTAHNAIDTFTPAQLTGDPIQIMLTVFDPNVAQFQGPYSYYIGDKLIFALNKLPTSGSVSEFMNAYCEINANGQFCGAVVEYTPSDPTGWDGDSFAFTVFDGYAESGPATVTLIKRQDPQTLTVNTSDDTVDGACDESHCSLREAVESSINGDSITFDLDTPTTISLQQGRLEVSHGITITGPGADQLAISGGETSGVFEFYDTFGEAPISSSMSGLTIKDGRADGGGGIQNGPNSTLTLVDCVIGPNNIVTWAGGGIYNYGNLTLNRCTVAGNHGTGAQGGAGIYAYSPEAWGGPAGSLTLVNSTVSNNITNNYGGGILADAGAVSLVHSTVTGNLANQNYAEEPWGGGGGIYIRNGYNTSLTVQNSIIAGNMDLTPQSEHNPFPDVFIEASVTLNSLGGNLIGDGKGSTGWAINDLVGTSAEPVDPMLDVLALNAPGSTTTHALLEGSPAIDAVDCLAEVTVDQRGVTRPQNALCDIGAFELEREDVTPPQLIITGATADGAPMPGNLSTGYILQTGRDPAVDHLLQFADGTTSTEPLDDQYFGLYLVDASVSRDDLKAYYDARGVPEPYLTYLKGAADGSNPFVYIKGSTVTLVDAAKHDIQALDVDMTVPDDYPLGGYTVQGQITDLAGNPTTVTLLLIVVPPPATWAVNATDDLDDGACDTTHCSLREAVKYSASRDRIEFNLPDDSTITLGGSEILIAKELTIEGPGADLLAISGNHTSRVFNIYNGSNGINVSISGLTIRDGSAPNGGGVMVQGKNVHLTLSDCVIGPDNIVVVAGGGIAVQSKSSAVLNRCSVVENQGTGSIGGAGIYVYDAGIKLVNSTVSGNVTNNYGGGIYVGYHGTAELIHSTVTANTANENYLTEAWGGAGGIYIQPNVSGTASLQNSIVAGNTDKTNPATASHPKWPDVNGIFTSSGGNLIGDDTGSSGWDPDNDLVGTSSDPIDPELDALALNAPGTTSTHALLADSQAIDAVGCIAEAAVDQRGVSRPQGAACDIGAYEGMIVVDNDPPETTITSKPMNPSNDPVPVFQFTSDEPGSTFWCDLDGEDTGPCTSPKDYNGLSDMAHTFTVTATDPAGNIDPTPATWTWTIDTVAPQTYIDINPPNPSGSSSNTFAFSGSVGTASFVCKLNNELVFSECSSPKIYAGLLDGTYTFDVKAIDAAGNADATPASYTWTVEAAPPTTTITSKPGDPSNSNAATFEFTSDDPSVMFICRMDGGVQDYCDSGVTYSSLADGLHYFEVWAKDAYQKEGTPDSWSWTIDTVAPDTVIDTRPAHHSNSSSATFTFHGTDSTSSSSPSGDRINSIETTIIMDYECQLDNGGYSDCTSPKDYTSLSDGSHSFQVRAIDAAGNVDSTPASNNWTIDTVPPETDIDGKPGDPSNDASPSFSFSSPDGDSFSCQLDSLGWSYCTSPQDYSGLADGSHTFEVRATDLSNNTDASPASYTWTIDTIAPETVITVNPSDPSNDPNPSFSFNASTSPNLSINIPIPTDTFECKLDTGTFSTCESPKSYSGLGDGIHTFYVRATDRAGNTDQTPAEYTWTIDTQAPDTTITSHPANLSNSASDSFEFTSPEAGTTFECQLDSGGFSSCSSPKVYTSLLDGSHTFEVRATDVADNTDPTPDSFTWTIDTLAPDTTITSQPTDPSSSTNASFSFTSSESGAFECQLDGGGWFNCTSPQSYTSLLDGSHTFEVKATDSTGNTDPDPASFTWMIDTAAPDTTINTGPSNPSNSPNARFTFSSADPGATFECQMDGGGFAGCSSPKDYTGLIDGLHTFQVQARDAAANVDSTPASQSWTIDTVPPDTSIYSSPSNPSNSADASFSFSAPFAVSFECKLDTGTFSACTSPQNYTGLADGSHTFQVRATDEAGNTDPTPASFTWTINTSNTMHVSDMSITLKDGRTHTLNALVTMVDNLNALLSRVVVTIKWQVWSSGVWVDIESRTSTTATTSRSGEAKFTLRGLAPGKYRLCVNNAVKAGYEYVSGETCQEITIP